MNGDEAPQLAQLRKVPAERYAAAVMPAAAVVWTATEIMHATGLPSTFDRSAAAALAAALAWGASARWKRIPRLLPWWIAATGGWVTIAAGEGPLYGGWPYMPLTWLYAVVSLYAWRKARRHPSILEAQEWRQQRAEWLQRSHRWGLGKSHLLKFEKTRLGVRYVVDTRGTGKLASTINTSAVAELIAEDHWHLPTSRIQVRRPGFPGRVEISIREIDPWAKPILHPVVAADPEMPLRVPCSIRGRVPIGQDPETGRPLSVVLVDETGAKNVNVVSKKGGGKTVLLDNLSERITAADDAVQVRVNLSVKGLAEEARWGPACLLTALGRNKAGRAVKVLRAVNGIVEWRSTRYTTTQWVPSREDPLIVVIIDESDSAVAVKAVSKEINDIATKGRELGVALVRAGQRGTTDYGSAKARSQDDTVCVGKVNRQGEAYHAAGEAGLGLPGMAAYGEGNPGVWGIVEDSGAYELGRTWMLSEDPAEQTAVVARIARDRAFAQPELPAACRAFLGETYEELLDTDVFAKWAREQSGQPAPAAPPPRPGDGSPAPAATSPTPVATIAGDIDHLDWDMPLNPDDRERLAALDAKNAKTRKILEEAAARPAPPEVSAEAMAAHTAARWRMVGDDVQATPEQMQILTGLLKTGTTIREVAKALGVSDWTARTYLQKALNLGLAWLDKGESGKGGRGSRWRLQEPQDGDGS